QTLNQAVESLTTVPARLLGLADSGGTLEPGKNADIVGRDTASPALVAVLRRGGGRAGADRVAPLVSPSPARTRRCPPAPAGTVSVIVFAPAWSGGVMYVVYQEAAGSFPG
ncbi:amidohydrolase family protein, partial [Streptomyces sp. BE303]|uniref:amidohydrolase family protein n=1 Tax=Streptomyces sp. BE303 TaxID=3002528 RepID=UPI002E776FDC